MTYLRSVRSLASAARLEAARLLRVALGSRVDERRWERRSREDVRAYVKLPPLPHREWLATELLRDPSVRSVLEIGAGRGANLEVLAKRSSSVRFEGIDISPESVSEGRDLMQAAGRTNVSLSVGNACDLSAFGDRSVDVIFSDAVLLYVGPDKIDVCIREMLRVARSRVVLVELHQADAGAAGRYTRDGWVRDYVRLLQQIAGSTEVGMTPIPPALRPGGRWPTLGAMIQIRLDPEVSTRG
jgi:SAM-dependent methyltransferase